MLLHCCHLAVTERKRRRGAPMFTYTLVFSALVILLTAVLLQYFESISPENEAWNLRVAAEMEELREKFKSENHSAFVVGYTGESGKELVKAMLKSKIFSRVVLIGRREVKYEDELYKDVEQKVVDFDKLDEYKEAFEGLDHGFCCLGTTRGKSGADGFYKVDHDYVMATGRMAKEAGVKHFHLMSSQGANKDAWLLYTKTKGQVEEEMKQLDFDRLVIYRPAGLLCDRQERRTGEKVAFVLMKPITSAFPTAISIPTSTLAEGMLNAAVSAPSTDKKWELLTNKAIHQLAGTAGKQTKAEGASSKN